MQILRHLGLLGQGSPPDTPPVAAPMGGLQGPWSDASHQACWEPSMPDRGVQQRPPSSPPAGYACPVAGRSIKDIEVGEDCACHQSVAARRQELMD